ncbi:huntingtin [Battus philenor]|uniref:huntingtin n=1 Tax=Battus philenor TaxID=42288 RepID=UPI0035D050B7
MNILEKAEKSLEFLKSGEANSKGHEIQAAAGTLGRCLGALGSRPNCARHYANLLHSAVPTLLSLASNDSAEVRLVGDEALNRAVAGGFAFHSYKTNIILQNQIDYNKSARWIRAALSRICLGDCWLRPGVGKIRTQAQTLFPKLSQIVHHTNEIQLIVEALELNLPRILNALAEYTTDEEISELSKSLLSHVDCPEASVRRGIAACVAHLTSHREPLLTNILGRVFEHLWPIAASDTAVIGWFCIIKAMFQINDMERFTNNDLFSVQDYLELYQLCIHYLELTTTEHNVQNAVMECLSVLLSQANGQQKKALLEKQPRLVCLDDRQNEKGHRRNISSVSVISTRTAPSPLTEPREPELMFSGALQLGSLLQLTTPSLSVEDLTIQTPDTPVSDTEIRIPDAEQLSKDLTEKLEEIEETDHFDDEHNLSHESGFKINIGSSVEDDVVLKYCARLLASKFLLTGNKGGIIPDRSVRVSVKASALNCLSEILRIYPQAITMYIDKDADLKMHNYSGSTEGVDFCPDNISDFILERNVCYQDSITESTSQELSNKSTDTQTNTQSHLQTSKKSADRTDSPERKSSKDTQSNVLDCKMLAKIDLVASGISADSTNANMTNSNFTSNSNMSGSNDPISSGYPMSSSGDVLSSSIDLDMKFDHFGESATNLDNLDALKDLNKNERKKPLKRTDLPPNESEVKCQKIEIEDRSERDFEFQHMCDVFGLLEGHSDPQIRGMVRVCIASYLNSALDLSHGDYNRWRSYAMTARDIADSLGIDKLMDIILKGLSDEIHSTVNHTLTSLTNLSAALFNSAHWTLVINILNSLVKVENNNYWLCRVNLCKLYMKLPYHKLFMLCPEYYTRSKQIMDTLYRLLGDQDQKVRGAAAQTIANIVPKIYPPRRETPSTMMAEIAKQQSEAFNFDHKGYSLDLVRKIYFYSDLPQQVKDGDTLKDCDALAMIIGDLVQRLLSSNCKFYSHGLLEALQLVCKRWSPWNHKDAFTEQGILSYCLDSLDYCNGTVATRSLMLNLCCMIYPVEIHNVMRHKTTNRDIFERDYQNITEKWQHLENEKVASLAEKFLQVTLKMLNVLVHLIEEVNPNVHLNRSGIALPGSPVRRKTQDPIQRKAGNSPQDTDDKGSLRKKVPIPATSLKANFAGHFFNEPFYMKLYENLRAMYSNHKINLDPKSSIFYDYLATVLNCLAVQLELATEKEFGYVTEEILYYLKVLMPLCPDKTVYCITQLLKCLFGTNMINQYNDYMSISNNPDVPTKTNFYQDVMLVNSINSTEDSRRSSVCSNASQKLSLDSKNPRMVVERQLLIALENFSKNKTDRKWSTNKKELERYIRLFEPVVIQALKSYTMQNDVPLQCEVLSLLNQLLALRVNYCMLDSDQIFIGFLMKQLDLVEQHEIPNCCELVNSILLFLVQLSSSKHHTKQIIEIPKLIQLCDGLMASGAHLECTAGLEPVAVRVFSNMGGSSVLGRAQQQEAQATREVLFYMLQKTMHQHKVLDLVSCVLALSQDHPESYYRWSELASDTLLNLLTQRSIEIDSSEAISSLERLLDSVYKDVLLEQSRVEILLKILFKAPPDQATTPRKQKLRYLSIIMTLIRKVLVLIPESEILLSINYLKSTCISPQSIFFNVKPDVDPLNVQSVNETCANLSPDVILVRFLFKTLTFAIIEMEDCQTNLDLETNGDKDDLLYAVCVNIVVHVKHMLHLTNGCLFPLTAKTAQNILHNEQSGLNTGLYSPEENIPLDRLNMICLKSAHRLPLLIVHWSHLLIRLNFLSQKYWHKMMVGPGRGAEGGARPLGADVIHAAYTLAYCEYFVDNGLTQAVHLTWLLVNLVHVLISQHDEGVVKSLIAKVQQNSVASGLLLQAIAARCQGCLKDEFALNTYKVLSLCHDSQSGALIFLICRIIGKLEPAIAVRFANLAIERCKILAEVAADKVNTQLSKEDLQVAIESLQRDKIHIRYPGLVVQLNRLAANTFDLSPLDLTLDRVVNPQNVITTTVDGNWLVNEIKIRCRINCSFQKHSNHNDLALLLSNLSKEDLQTVMSCPEFDRKILSSCFKVSCDSFIREFLNIISVSETKELEKERAREHEFVKVKEEMTSSIDSNKLNVVNSLHVFKRNDSRESKSQFFIPMNEVDKKEGFGNLKLSEEELELTVPDVPDLYQISLSTLDKSISDILRLFPKQNRPLSQSENFNLNIEQTIDRYTKRCHQVFQDKLFYQEFITVQTILIGFLDALDRIVALIDEADCDLLEKCIENIIPVNLGKNLAIFSVVSLQYLSFLIKNKKEVESPVHADVSFRATNTEPDNIIVDYVISVTVDNVARALSFEEIWSELNVDSNFNRTQSAVSCLFAVLKYLVKDTKPLILKQYMPIQDSGPRSDFTLISDKLITMVQYWEQNFYSKPTDNILAKGFRKPIESLLVSLSRLEVVSNIALIPPIAWSYVEATVKNDTIQKIDLPLQALQDMDVLESFLFRVNLIGWSSKKQFEEIWVGLLGALQGNGTHWAVRGITQLLISTAPRVRRRGILHVPRTSTYLTEGMQRLRQLLVGTSAYEMFEDVNLERVPLMKGDFNGYHYAQFSTDYLKLASDITDEGSYKVRQAVKRKRKSKDIDVNSCLQLLMDVTSEMLEPKAPTGLAARTALLSSIYGASATFSSSVHWSWAGAQLAAHPARTHWASVTRALLHSLAVCLPVLHPCDGIQELSTVHQKLLKSLTSSYAPLRQAALHGCLLQLSGRGSPSGACHELVAQLVAAVRQYLQPRSRISLYEQSLYWTVLFTLVQLGHPDLMSVAVDFVINNRGHYCADLVVRGITSVIRQQILPKDLKKTIIERLLDNAGKYSECHAVQILMVHLFSADSRLLSPKLTSDVSNMDPDILMSSMERITLLYKTLKRSKLKESKEIVASALKYFLRETLPPAATLSRVVMEFIECCKDTEKKLGVLNDRQKWVQCSVLNAEVVYEVFETAVSQDQLPVLSGWIFEALCHLLTGKVSPELLPFCVLTLLVSASSNRFIRRISPLCYHVFRRGFARREDGNWGVFSDYLSIDGAMSFPDKRLLCVVATHSNFTGSQLVRLKELCENNECLAYLMQCLCV